MAAARIGVAATDPSATRTSDQPFGPSCQRQRHHDLRDRLGPPRPHLPEPQLAARRQREPHLEDQLVRRQRRLAVGDEVVEGLDLTLAALATDEDHRVRREEDRKRVARRRGVRDVAAERPAVLDLRRTDRRRRLDEGRQVLAAQRRAPDLRVRRPGAEDEAVALERDPPERVDSGQVQHPLRDRPELAGDRDHDVGAARDRARRDRRRAARTPRTGGAGLSIGGSAGISASGAGTARR